jgi:hypothetical protein
MPNEDVSLYLVVCVTACGLEILKGYISLCQAAYELRLRRR